jgi:putative hydrolase of the HAD superfamily
MSDFVKAARGSTPEKVIRPEFHKTITRATNSGVRLAILSNELDLFYGSDFRTKLPFLNRFEVIHDATYTKVLKPDPQAYLSCLAELNLGAEQCVFVDDQIRNIEGAIKVGMQTVHFDVQNPGHSYGKAERLLNL